MPADLVVKKAPAKKTTTTKTVAQLQRELDELKQRVVKVAMQHGRDSRHCTEGIKEALDEIGLSDVAIDTFYEVSVELSFLVQIEAPNEDDAQEEAVAAIHALLNPRRNLGDPPTGLIDVKEAYDSVRTMRVNEKIDLDEVTVSVDEA